MDGNWESELFFFTIQFLLDACNFKLKPVTPLKFALLVKNTKYLAKTILHSVDFFSLLLNKAVHWLHSDVSQKWLCWDWKQVCLYQWTTQGTTKRGMRLVWCRMSPSLYFQHPSVPPPPFFLDIHTMRNQNWTNSLAFVNYKFKMIDIYIKHMWNTFVSTYRF